MAKPDRIVRVTLDVPMRWYGDLQGCYEWLSAETLAGLGLRVETEAARVLKEQRVAEQIMEVSRG